MKTRKHRANCVVARAIFRILLLVLYLEITISCGKKNEETIPKKSASKQQTKGTPPKAVSEEMKLVAAAIDRPQSINSFDGWTRALEMVKEMGEKKQVEAIPLLLDSMFVLNPLSINNAFDLEDSYPCSAALIQIGEPAVVQVQERFLRVTDSLEQLILLNTLLRIEGPQAVSDWLGNIKATNNPSLTEKRLVHLQGWVLSHRR
jgi:hypothetical protein